MCVLYVRWVRVGLSVIASHGSPCACVCVLVCVRRGGGGVGWTTPTVSPCIGAVSMPVLLSHPHVRPLPADWPLCCDGKGVRVLSRPQ